MKNFLGFLIICVLIPLLTLSCDNDVNGDIGEAGRPIKRILEEKGNYGQFIKALELSGYDKLVNGGGLVTVFAPDDDAFRDFLKTEYSVNDVEDIPTEELNVIIGYHIIQFAYDPDDFLAFSSSSEGSGNGDGSSYKYKTYGKAPVKLFTDPRTGRKVHLYSREKFLPVLSSRLFKTRNISNPEKDYKRFFPNVEWAGTDNTLYSGDAVIQDMGIKAANGFLYTVDKVLKPLPSIYDRIASEDMSEYSIIKEMFDRINTYTYDANLTKNYSPTGDSLFLFNHWTAPSKNAEIPEIASEWTYHNENGVVFVNDTKYTNLCFFPKDNVLGPYLKEYFKELGTYEAKNFLDVIPDNAIFHFLKSHIYGYQEIKFPSEFNGTPIIGPNGEKYYLDAESVTPFFCSNGIIYGIDKILEPAVFTHLTETILREPYFDFYSRAFNIKNMYQQTVDDNNRFTLFVQDDIDLNAAGYISGVSTIGKGSYIFKRQSKNMNETQISDMLMSQFMYGRLPSMENIDYQRYFVSKDNKTYFYVKDKALYDALDNEVPVRRTVDASNGMVIQTGRVIPGRQGAYSESGKKSEFAKFRQLLVKAEIGNNSGGLTNSMAGMTDAIVFLPVNEAVDKAQAAGFIPSDIDTLRSYLKYYFVQLKKNKLDNFLLPGLGPDGMTSEAFSGRFTTMSEYVVEDDIKYMDISWSPEESSHLTLSDTHGTTMTTVDDRVELRTNAAVYALDRCFDYRKIFRKGKGANY